MGLRRFNAYWTLLLGLVALAAAATNDVAGLRVFFVVLGVVAVGSAVAMLIEQRP